MRAAGGAAARAAPASAAAAETPRAANEASAEEDRGAALLRLLDRENPDTVLVCMVDMQGRLVGKRLTARQGRCCTEMAGPAVAPAGGRG